MRTAIAGIALFLGLAPVAGAEPITSAEAREQLFTPDEMILEPADLGAFSRQVRQAANLMIDQLRAPGQMAKFLEAGYGYYGAVALPIEGGSQVPPTIIAQLNSPDSAEDAAINACQTANEGRCAVAAFLLPKGYEESDLTLSQAATDRIMHDWDEGPLPKFLAYSPSTSAWGIAKGPTASARTAIESCKESDCIVVVADQ